MPLVGAILSEHINSDGTKEISGFGYSSCFIENKALAENDLKKLENYLLNNFLN